MFQDSYVAVRLFSSRAATPDDHNQRTALASWSRRAAAVTVLVLAAVVVDAQTLTLEQAVTRALQESPDIKTADADVKVAEGELVRAKTLTYNPTVSGGIGPPRGPPRQ